jgi:hypothetical protein
MLRGDRTVRHFDLTSVEWPVNEYGAALQTLSRDPISGAISFVLRTPPGLQYPERAHFYDCDEDVFQVEGEYHHDVELPMREGDYVYRPPGAVYGNSQGTEGGVTFVSFARQPRRFHFESNPEPWTGEYLVDKAWNPGREGRLYVRSGALPWQAEASSSGLMTKSLRGAPVAPRDRPPRVDHSPWAAAAVCLVKYDAGYEGSSNPWGGWAEHLVLGGRAKTDANLLTRWSYSFTDQDVQLAVMEPMVCLLRLFSD